jgi:hypothetical protein
MSFPTPSPKRLARLLAAAALGVLALPAASYACGSSGYTYAGVASLKSGFGIASRLTATNDPLVQIGHVAGWIGVGGPKQGPNGTDEWIQVGFSAFPGSPLNNLYFEVARPGKEPVYQEVATAIPTGMSKRVAVLEMAHRSNFWRVWVNGNAVSEPIYLPGSHGSWRPMATAESWGGGSVACNAYRYQFGQLNIATAPGGGWRALTASYSFHSADYAVLRTTQASSTFVATANQAAQQQARYQASLRNPVTQ